MLIEDAEPLRLWLVSVLTPLCEADPEALAKYVMALIKKDKSEDELKRICLDQLDVFLQKNTPTFVDMFFNSLKSKSYLKPIETTTPTTSTAPSNKSSTSGLSSTVQATQSSSATRSSNSSNIPSSTQPSSGSATQSATQSSTASSSASNETRKREERPERRRRSRSPAKRREGWGDKEPGRNHWSDNKSRNRSKRSSRSRSRSPRRGDGRPRSRSPEKASDQGKRKRSGSPDDRHKKKERCRDYEEQGFCLKGDLCPFDHGSDPVVLDGIPFPNGSSAPPVPPVQVPLLPTPSGPWPNEPYNPEAPGMNLRPPPNMIPPPGIMGPPFPGPWNHQGPPPMPPMNMSNNTGPVRVLSTIVPVQDMGGHHGNGPPQYRGPMQDQRRGRGGRGQPRGGFQGHHNHRRMPYQRRMEDPEKRTLEVRKLPPELNTISKLNEYFGQFGEVTQLNVCYEGDREAALITFASHAQATAAHRCPDAVLGNRFIKLFWHSKERQEQDPAPEKTEGFDDVFESDVLRTVESKAGGRLSVKDRLGSIALEDVQITIQPRPPPSIPVQDPNLLKKSNVEKKEHVIPIMKTPDEQRKEKYLSNLLMKEKYETLLKSVKTELNGVTEKLLSSHSKEEQVKLKKLWKTLEGTMTQYMDSQRELEEKIQQFKNFSGRRGRGRGGYRGHRHVPQYGHDLDQSADPEDVLGSSKQGLEVEAAE